MTKKCLICNGKIHVLSAICENCNDMHSFLAKFISVIKLMTDTETKLNFAFEETLFRYKTSKVPYLMSQIGILALYHSRPFGPIRRILRIFLEASDQEGIPLKDLRKATRSYLNAKELLKPFLEIKN